MSILNTLYKSLLILAVIIHNAAGYLLGYWGCRLTSMDRQSSRSIAFEVGMQNGELAYGIAVEMGRIATIWDLHPQFSASG